MYTGSDNKYAKFYAKLVVFHDNMKNISIALFLSLSIFCGSEALAFTAIPDESGFSGYILAGGGYTKTSSNMIVGTDTTDLTDSSTGSLFDSPDTKGALTTTVLGKLNYTFASIRTQLFVGQLFTDFIRYDVINTLGVRQETKIAGTIGAGYVISGFITRVWQDPYVVNVDRVETDREQAGWRVSWEKIFNSQLMFQYTQRKVELDEKSGTTQLSLSPQDSQLLDRNGDLYELLLSYEWELSEHNSLIPELQYDKVDTYGLAMNAERWGIKLMHSYLKKDIGLLFVTSISYANADYEAENPIYNKTRKDDRYGLDLTYLQFGLFNRYKSQIALVTNAFYFYENSNINFYDQKIYGINLSLLFRF